MDKHRAGKLVQAGKCLNQLRDIVSVKGSEIPESELLEEDRRDDEILYTLLDPAREFPRRTAVSRNLPSSSHTSASS